MFEFETEDGEVVRTSGDPALWTCGECGRLCEPIDGYVEGFHMRIVFTCPDHGPQSVFDPYSASA